jgi:hypothetical protein
MSTVAGRIWWHSITYPQHIARLGAFRLLDPKTQHVSDATAIVARSFSRAYKKIGLMH